jgi:hypothetical protein
VTFVFVFVLAKGAFACVHGECATCLVCGYACVGKGDAPPFFALLLGDSSVRAADEA